MNGGALFEFLFVTSIFIIMWIGSCNSPAL
jgi:hypothetical protein